MSSDKLLLVSSLQDEKLEGLQSDISGKEFAIFNNQFWVSPPNICRDISKTCTELDCGLDYQPHNENYYIIAIEHVTVEPSLVFFSLQISHNILPYLIEVHKEYLKLLTIVIVYKLLLF